MRTKYKLTAKEETQRKVLTTLLVFIPFIIIKGIINQSNNINQDNILYPTFLTMSVIFCSIYTFNAFTSGNLVKNWSSPPIFAAIFDFIRNKSSMSDEKATILNTKIFGLFTLCLAVIGILIGIKSFFTGKW